MLATALNATIVRRDEVAPGLIVLGVKPDAPLFSFEPGQYATLGLAGEAPRHASAKHDRDPVEERTKLIKRAYSIASPNTQRDCVEFYLNMVDDGSVTPRLFAVPIGGRVWLSAKAVGTFTLDGVLPTDDVVMIATGTGIAPFVSMVLSRFEPRDARYWALIHGTRNVVDLGYRAEMSAIKGLIYLPTVSRPEIPWPEPGRVNRFFENGAFEKVTGKNLDPKTTHIYLCGNPEMILQMQRHFEECGFVLHRRHAPGTLHIESYW
ncbi:MAG: ferredoxin--NADP reductase [Clostridia bacterium]|nr:ferredoxin--NADP reductase [Deltaproteobacteria bacterium]